MFLYPLDNRIKTNRTLCYSLFRHRQHSFTLGQYSSGPSLVVRGTKSICWAVSPDELSRLVTLERHLNQRLRSITSKGIDKQIINNSQKIFKKFNSLINNSQKILELSDLRLGLFQFLGIIQGKAVAVFSDNTTVLLYLAKEGDTYSTFNMCVHIVEWAEHSISLPNLSEGVHLPYGLPSGCL